MVNIYSFSKCINWFSSEHPATVSVMCHSMDLITEQKWINFKELREKHINILELLGVSVCEEVSEHYMAKLLSWIKQQTHLQHQQGLNKVNNVSLNDILSYSKQQQITVLAPPEQSGCALHTYIFFPVLSSVFRQA